MMTRMFIRKNIIYLSIFIFTIIFSTVMYLKPDFAFNTDGTVKPQEKDWATSDKAKSAKIFKDARRRVVDDPKYIHMRKQWRQRENANL